MSPVGSVRDEAEPVSLAAKSELFTPVVFAGAAPLAVVEAVTVRVSVLPVVGSDLLTGLSVAAGVTDQLFLDSGSILDKVGHGAGQSSVRMVPAERLPELREVRDIMFSWMRPVAVLTSQKGMYGDADWLKDNPNRAGGTVVARTDATVAQYCPYKRGS